MLTLSLLRLVHILFFTLLFWGMGASLRSIFPSRDESRSIEETVVGAIGLGLATLILLVFLLGFFNGGLTSTNLFFILGLLAAVWLALRFKRTSIPRPAYKPDHLFFLLLALLLVTRLLQVRELYVPNWVDGLNHQFLLERWDGIATISSDRIYHAGFHMAVLALHYLTGWDFPSLMLSFGQWLGILSGLALYTFLKGFFGRRSLAFLTAVIYSLFLLFPSYLVSWGRYPLLQGLALLPLALSLTLGWLRRTEQSLLPALTVLIALVLSHYGMLLFWGAFIVMQHQLFDDSHITGITHVKRFAWLILPLGLVMIPRVVLLFLRTDFLHKLLDKGQSPLVSDVGYVWGLIVSHDWPFLILSAIGLILAWMHDRRLLSVAVDWTAVVFALAYIQTQMFNFSAFGYENVLIFLLLPFGLLAGLTVERVADRVRVFRPALAWTLAIVFLGAGLWRGANVINPATILFTASDRLALDWVSANTPPDAVFLVNSTWWGDRYTASDGGGWIGSLTGRTTVLPATAADLADVSRLVRRTDVDYIYLRNGEGELALAQFLDTTRYESVYVSSGVTIYRVVPSD